MSYESALEAAGAIVHDFASFGSYQGEWWAKVTYNGETGWISGSYGSCSGCDAFEAEFGYYDDERDDYQARLADFGKAYLGGLCTQEQAEKYASANIDWDQDAEEMLSWIKANKIND